jgi:ribose 5-phosphate isomerase A
MSDQDELKRAVAKEALRYIRGGTLGVGTGSTVDCFIDQLATIKNQLDSGVVASSIVTEKKLKSYGIPVIELNQAPPIDFYVDGADECVLSHFYLVKGGGGALTREKIVASAAKQFICIVDSSKCVSVLGESMPVPVEVIPMARSFVARQLLSLKGQSPTSVHPVYRQGFVTDNGHVILDVYGLNIVDPAGLELALNNIPGVVDNGIFAHRTADKILVASEKGISVYSKE